MTVSSGYAPNSSTGNGVTTVFPYNFRILAAADLEVTVDGVVKTLTTDYSVSGVGVAGGGNVTFVAAPANGTTVIRRRNMALVRTTDYQDNGDLLADVLNPDQDAPILMAQQLQEQITRSLKAPLGDTTDMTLPAAAGRANKGLVFDVNGKPLMSSDLGDLNAALLAAAAAAAAAGTSADAAAGSAASASSSAGTATTQAGLAATAKTGAETAKTGAEAAMAATAASAKLYGDYPTAVGATVDGDFFSLYATDLVARLIYKRVAGQGELQGVQPFLRQQTAEAARLLANTMTFDAATVAPAAARVDFVPVDGLFGYINLRNRAWAGGAPDLNLFGRSRPGEFPVPTTSGSFAVTSVTTTFGVAGADAALKAVRVQYAGSGASVFAVTPLSAAGAASIPPGRWTIAYDVISNTGSASTYRMYSAPSGTYGNVTANTTWGTVSQTFVVTAYTANPNWQLFREAASPAVVDITIDNIRLVPGSTAGSASASNEHVWRPHGLLTMDSLTPRGTGLASTGSRALVPLAASATFTGITVIMAVRKEGSATTGFLFSDDETNATGFNITDNGTVAGGIGVGLNAAHSDMVNLGLNQWYVLGVTAGTDGSAMFLNGLKITPAAAAALTPFTTDYFSIAGLASRQDANFIGKYASVRVHTRATMLTDAEMLREFAVAKARIAAQGEQFTDYGTVVIFDGDSLTAGLGATNQFGYAKMLGSHFTPYLQGINYAVAGNTMASLTASKASVKAKIAEAIAAGKRVIFHVMIGINEQPANNAAADTYYTGTLKPYWAEMRATGAKLIVGTMGDVSTNGAPQRAVNAYLRGLIIGDATLYDGCADYGGSALGTYSAGNYADTVHWNDTGHALAETILRPVVTPFVLP